MKKIIFFLLIIFMNGCSYYSFKGSIPAHINSISIAPIVNESSEFGISEQVMSQLNNYFIKENILDLLGENEADSRLTIIIKSLEDKPFTYSINNQISSEFERVEEWQIKIHVEINWHDIKRDKSLLKTNLSPWGAYGTGTDISIDRIDNDNDGKIDEEDDDEFGSPRESAIRIAINKLSEELINQITSTW